MCTRFSLFFGQLSLSLYSLRINTILIPREVYNDKSSGYTFDRKNKMFRLLTRHIIRKYIYILLYKGNHHIYIYSHVR